MPLAAPGFEGLGTRDDEDSEYWAGRCVCIFILSRVWVKLTRSGCYLRESQTALPHRYLHSNFPSPLH